MRCTALIIISLGMSLSACKKTNQYEVNGVVKEFYDQKGVNDVEVEVSYSQIGYGSVSGGYEVITSTHTDENGAYALAFDFVATPTFRVRMRKEGYFMRERFIHAEDWSTEEANALDESMYKAASITFHFVNDDDPNSQLLLDLDPHSEGCEACCDHLRSWLFEGITDTTFTCTVYGNQYITYKLTTITQSGASEYEGAVEVDEGNYEVNYAF